MGHSIKRIEYKSGQKYYNFTITNRAPSKRTSSGYSYTCWECICDCGQKFITTTKQIRRGVRRSCGCMSKSNRFKQIPVKDVVINIKNGHYKQKAKERSIEWQLTKDQFAQLIFKDCNYCNQKPSMKVKGPKGLLFVNGVDRVNSSVGYKLENCVPCCKICNRAKGDMSIDDFKQWIKKIYVYNYIDKN
jgi:5-methylcytosine-specific restriction endonuclease McrA